MPGPISNRAAAQALKRASAPRVIGTSLGCPVEPEVASSSATPSPSGAGGTEPESQRGVAVERAFDAGELDQALDGRVRELGRRQQDGPAAEQAAQRARDRTHGLRADHGHGRVTIVELRRRTAASANSSP